MKKRTKRNSRGFTLIEVIVAIVIVAILGTFLVSYMSGGIAKSGLPVIWVKQEFNIFETMERFTADYQKALLTSFSLSNFKTSIDSAPYLGDGMTVISELIDIDRKSGVSPPPSPLILKVKLQKGDQSVTALFTN